MTPANGAHDRYRRGVADHDPGSFPTDPVPADEGGSRRSRLLTVKLRALVGDHLGHTLPDVDAPGFPPGAAVLVHDQAWVLVDDAAGVRPGDRPANRLGSALAWALRRGASALHVVTEVDEGILARRAGFFGFPVTVWRADGRRLAAAAPASLPTPVPALASHLAVRELIAAGGATPVVEHGVVSGEVRGLEVCRVVDDVAGGPDRPPGARLEIGVGVHDREAFQMLHGHTPTVESLSRVVDAVREHRVPGAARHPFNRMAAERLLRWRVEDEPSLLDESLTPGGRLTSVSAVEPPLPRSSAVEAVPCVAHGTDRDGRLVVLVFSSGVDLDVVPYAADARLAAEDREEAAGAGAVRLVVVTPARDRLPVTAELAGLLDQSLELASIA